MLLYGTLSWFRTIFAGCYARCCAVTWNLQALWQLPPKLSGFLISSHATEEKVILHVSLPLVSEVSPCPTFEVAEEKKYHQNCLLACFFLVLVEKAEPTDPT